MRINCLRKFFSVLCALLLICSFAPNSFSQTKASYKANDEPRDEKLWRRALEIQRKAIVVDGHNDITTPMVDERYDLGTPSAGKYHTDIARLKQGGVTAQFFAIYVDNDYVVKGQATRRALEMIDMVRRAVENHPADLMFATSVEDIRRAKREGKIAALMGIENGAAIENSLGELRDFYRLGVRYMTLTHVKNNDWADSSTDKPAHNGLTDFGREVVREMNRLGMLVDISHVGDKTMSDAIDVSRAPVIASHSSARALVNAPRDIPDDLLRKIAKNGGVVMVNFYPAFVSQQYRDAQAARDAKLKPQIDALRETYKNDPKRLAEEIKKLEDANPLPSVPISAVIDHIDHIKRVIGVDYIGLGSDFDGIPSTPEGLKDVSQFPNITYELLKRGYTEAEIRKILGENFLRVFAEAERVARELGGDKISGNGSLRRIEDKQQ
jgi:membrane dipeptidase